MSEKPQRKRWGIPLAAVAVLVVYFLSLGPFFLLIQQMDPDHDTVAMKACRIVYWPAIQIFSQFELYFRYVDWWASLGGSYDQESMDLVEQAFFGGSH
jgi:hypothetical protein